MSILCIHQTSPNKLYLYTVNHSIFSTEEKLHSLVAQRIKRLPAMQETGVRSLVWEDPWRRKWHPTPVFLPGEFHGQRILVGYSSQGHKESDMTKRLHTHTITVYFQQREKAPPSKCNKMKLL